MALGALAGAVCEAADAAAKAVRRAAGLITPATPALVPAASLMAVQAMEDATEAVRILHETLTDDADGGGDEDGEEDEDGPVPVAEIPLLDAAPETMN